MSTINGQKLFTGGDFNFDVHEASVNFDFLDSDNEDYKNLANAQSVRFSDSGGIIEPSEVGGVDPIPIKPNIRPVSPVKKSQYGSAEEEFVVNNAGVGSFVVRPNSGAETEIIEEEIIEYEEPVSSSSSSSSSSSDSSSSSSSSSDSSDSSSDSDSSSSSSSSSDSSSSSGGTPAEASDGLEDVVISPEGSDLDNVVISPTSSGLEDVVISPEGSIIEEEVIEVLEEVSSGHTLDVDPTNVSADRSGLISDLYTPDPRLQSRPLPPPQPLPQEPIARAAMVEKAKELDAQIADQYMDLGKRLKQKGDFEGAELELNKALALRRKCLGKNHPDTASSYYQLGLLYYQSQQYGLALSDLKRALTLGRTVWGRHHEDTACTYFQLGLVLNAMQDFKTGLRELTKAYNIFRKVLGPDHPATARTMQYMGDSYAGLGDSVGAVVHYSKALAIQMVTMGKHNPQTIETFHKMTMEMNKR